MRKTLILIAAVALLASCNKMPYAGKAIAVRVAAADTKGTVTTTSGLVTDGKFAMDAYIAEPYSDGSTTHDPGKYIDSGGNGNVTQSAGKWSIAGSPTWIAGTPTRFWAWHPVTLAAGTRTIVGPSEDGSTVSYGAEQFAFRYTVPDVNGTTDADSATDLLFAYTKKNYSSLTDENVDITFHHALSQIRFCVSTTDGTFDPSLGISNVTITNLKTSGSAFFSATGFDWDNQEGNGNFGQNYEASFTTLPAEGWTAGEYTSGGRTYDLHTCRNVFFMIPQVVKDRGDDSTNHMQVTFVYNGTPITKSVAIAGTEGVEWLADHYYTYKINATIIGRDIDVSVSLMSWSDRDDLIFI